MWSRRMNIKEKLSIISIATIISSVLVLSIILYTIYSRNYKELVHEQKQQTLELLSYNTNSYFDEINNLTLSTISNRYLLQRLAAAPAESEYYALERQREIESFLTETMVNNRHDIVSIQILMVEGREIYRSGISETSLNTGFDYKSTTWFEQALNGSQRTLLPPHEDELEQKRDSAVMSLVRLINNPSTLRPLAIIKVNVNTNTLEKYFEQLDMGNAGCIILFDESEQIFMSRRAEKISDRGLLEQRGTGYTDWLYINGIKYIYNETATSEYGLQICSFSSTEVLSHTLLQQLVITALVAIACSFMALIISKRLFQTQLVQPINQIVSNMKKVELKGDEFELPSDRHDEIGYLGKSFYDMVMKINRTNAENVRLLTQVYESRELQSQAQLHALQAQIKPHFICNTLNMISMLIQCDEKEAAVDNINRLSRLMRGIANYAVHIPLSQELSFLRAYLDIQKTRYVDRLTYKEEISQSLYNYPIPAFLLQPIVENSILHGCENKAGRTTIRIFDRTMPDHLEIIIADDACGIPDDILQTLRSTFAQTNACNQADAHIGLANIHHRIRLFFGEEYGLTISSSYGNGTIVIISLPLIPPESKVTGGL